MDKSPTTSHVSVLLREVVAHLRPPSEYSQEKYYLLDCTLGGAGHARALLESDSRVFLLGVDRDWEALQRARVALADFGSRVELLQGNFAEVKELILKSKSNFAQDFLLSGGKFQAILLDLGVSSDQLDQAQRGFSFMRDAALDMRMDQNQALNAATVVNEYDLSKLVRVLRSGGVGPKSRALARAIIERRPIANTLGLAQICAEVLFSYQPQAQHPATVPFQAIRIEVNQELASLEKFLAQVLPLLAPGGVLAAISFHSLEDTLVTRAMRAWSRPPREVVKIPRPGDELTFGKLLTAQAIFAAPSEVEQNPRARSARLRVFQRNNQQH